MYCRTHRWGLLSLILLTSAVLAWRFAAEPDQTTQAQDKGGEATKAADVTAAALAFVNTLGETAREQTVLPFDSAKRFEWHFIPKEERKGLQLREMNPDQKDAARDLLATCLSRVGYEKAAEIMELEKILEKLEGSAARFKRDYLRYYFTLFGEPNREGKWGLSIEGHHLSLNFVIENDKIAAHTPAFFGANPALVMSEAGVGPSKGTRVLAKEELLAFELVNSLSGDQKPLAIKGEKAPEDIRAAGEPQPPQTPPEGIAAASLNADQQKLLRTLIEVYARNMRPEIAQRDLEKIDAAGFENVYFAWQGALEPGVGHYYRIQGPTFLIEFVNVQPDAAGNPANHIHCVWRDVAGDFGMPAGQ